MNAGADNRTGIFRLHKRTPVWNEIFVKSAPIVIYPKCFDMLPGCQSAILIEDMMGYIEQKQLPE